MSRPPRFIEQLRDRLDARLIETHISWVLVTATDAYKIKKPVDLGFLDFSTPDRRLLFCAEEIRLNRRLAPEIYVDVLPITISGSEPVFGGETPALDWAVHMRAFDPDATLDRQDNLLAAQIDAIADRVAGFHLDIPAADTGSPHGSPDSVLQPARENFRQISHLHPPEGTGARLRKLEEWTEQTGRRLQMHFATRKREGYVRECHGDLHLGNIAWHHDAPLIFDCLEFNPDLRFIDVASEVAFLCMDLISRSQESLSWRFLNRYLESTGDYGGLAALPFYMVYRAMVRAKVACIRACQEGATPSAGTLSYLDLAERLSQSRQTALLLMHGVSGSGKTWASQDLLQELGAIRLRSDVERKRLFGLRPMDDSARIPGGIYTEEASRHTFAHLLDLSRQLMEQGYPVIVDATFLKQAHRQPFVSLARQLQCPLHIVSVEADEATLRDRVQHRILGRHDASEATLPVLESQLQALEPFSVEEQPLVICLDGRLGNPSETLHSRLHNLYASREFAQNPAEFG